MKLFLPLSLRNPSSSKKKARKESAGQLFIIGMMRPCVLSQKGTRTVVFSMVFRDDGDVVIGKVFSQ